jgi:hypothetical protein
VREALVQEGLARDDYADELRAHSPYAQTEPKKES